MRVLFLGSYHRDADRNRIILRGLQTCGDAVIEHRFPMDSLRFRGTGLTLVRGLCRAGISLPSYLAHMVSGGSRARDADVVFVGYLGHHDMAAVGMLRRVLRDFRDRPLVFDPFFSLYDTIVSDRRLLSQGSAGARLLYRAEKWMLSRADLVLADTAAHGNYYRDMARLEPGRIRIVPVGVDESAFPPREYRPRAGSLRVLFYGTYIPLHGIDTILRAADLLRDEEVYFRLIGRGQTRSAMDSLARELALENLEFADWVPFEQLAAEIGDADIVLGIFGTTGKASRVVPNKVFQALSVGRCVITRDSPAVREKLVPEKHVAVCPAGDPEGLASVIRELKENVLLRLQLAKAGPRIVQEQFCVHAVGRAFHDALASALRLGPRPSPPTGRT